MNSAGLIDSAGRFFGRRRADALVGDGAALALVATRGPCPSNFAVDFWQSPRVRARAVAGDRAKMKEYLTEANKAAEEVPDEESKTCLLEDLATIG